MVTVPTLVEESAAPAEETAVGRALLARAVADSRPQLRVYAWPGDVLSVGRHHAVPVAPQIVRRLSGGRAFPAGAGFVQVALALPHRSAIESDDPLALRPEQVLNRAVRGVMAALARFGIEPYYPGRDVLTVGGKPIGWISLAVDAAGATLVESGLSVARDWSVLAAVADRLDPGGVTPVRMWGEDEVTSIARACGRAPAVAEVLEAVVAGHRDRFAWAMAPAAPPVVGTGDVAEPAVPLANGRTARRGSMLGVLVAQVVTGEDALVRGVRLGGDLIAPAETLRSLERVWVGAPLVRAALLERANHVLADPAAFLLGATPDDLVEVVLAAGATE